MANFSASEDGRQSVKLESQAQSIQSLFSQLATTCSTIGSIIQSEDSSLGNAWNENSDSFANMGTAYDAAMTGMANRMKLYAAKTKATEAASEAITNAKSKVRNNIADKFQSMADFFRA